MIIHDCRIPSVEVACCSIPQGITLQLQAQHAALIQSVIIAQLQGPALPVAHGLAGCIVEISSVRLHVIHHGPPGFALADLMGPPQAIILPPDPSTEIRRIAALRSRAIAYDAIRLEGILWGNIFAVK